MNWYYVDQGQQAGPVDDAQLEQLRASGRVLDDTLIWREGMANWLPYRDAKGSVAPAAGAASAPVAPAGTGLYSPSPAAASGTPDAVCSECRNMFPKDNMIRYGNNWVCSNCKPVFMQKLAEGANINAGALRYAGFWIRVAAKLLDWLILGVVIFVPIILVLVVIGVSAGHNGSSSLHLENDVSLHAATNSGMASLIGNVFGILFQLLFVGLYAIYAGFFVGKYGATPGKMACKLIVVDANGAPVSYGRAFGRGFAEILSRMICYIGYIIVAFDNPQKRALHDHICGTRVIYKEG